MNLLRWVSDYFKSDPPRPKWRDEISILSFIFPTIIIVSLGILGGSKWAKSNAFEYPLSILTTIIFYILGHISGHKSGVETERLFPSGYKWDLKQKEWVKK